MHKDKTILSNILKQTSSLHKQEFGSDLSNTELDSVLADILIEKRIQWLKDQLSDNTPQTIRAMRKIIHDKLHVEPGQLALKSNHVGAKVIQPESKATKKKRKKARLKS